MFKTNSVPKAQINKRKSVAVTDLGFAFASSGSQQSLYFIPKTVSIFEEKGKGIVRRMTFPPYV